MDLTKNNIKYKVGDKVLIKSIDWYNKYKDKDGFLILENSMVIFLPYMVSYLGEVATITSIKEEFESYKIDIDEGRYFWTDEMFDETYKNNKMESKKVKITLPKNCEVEKVETSVEDGYLVVEYTPKEKFEPKDGDILYAKLYGTEWIIIFNQETNVGTYIYHCMLIVDSGLSFNDWCVSENFKLANEEQKNLLFSELKKQGLMWNQETKKIENIKWIPEEGDILSDGKFIVLYKETHEYGGICCYCYLYGDREFEILKGDGRGCGLTIQYHLANKDERERLLNKIKEQGYTFNKKTKKLEKIRWRAKYCNPYYFILSNGKVAINLDDFTSTDDNRFEIGNYFQTKEEAQIYADKTK